jgi:hypothetical protein
MCKRNTLLFGKRPRMPEIPFVAPGASKEHLPARQRRPKQAALMHRAIVSSSIASESSDVIGGAFSPNRNLGSLFAARLQHQPRLTPAPAGFFPWI